MSRCAGVKTTRRKGHVVCGADGPDGGGGGGVVKGEINELRNKGKDRRGISALLCSAAGQLTPPLSGCDPKEIAAGHFKSEFIASHQSRALQSHLQSEILSCSPSLLVGTEGGVKPNSRFHQFRMRP